MEPLEEYDGYYSPSHDLYSGHAVYLNKQGEFVAVTDVVPLGCPPFCKDADAVYVGKVTKHVQNNDIGKVYYKPKWSTQYNIFMVNTEPSAEPVPDAIILNKDFHYGRNRENEGRTTI